MAVASSSPQAPHEASGGPQPRGLVWAERQHLPLLASVLGRRGGGAQSPQSRLARRRGRKDRLWTGEIRGRIPTLAHLPPHACPSSRGPGPSMLSLSGTPSQPHIPLLITALWSHPQGHSPCWPLGYPRCCGEGPSPGPSLSLRSHCRPTLSGASGALYGLPTKCWA